MALTLTLDDDREARLCAQARRDGRPLDAVVVDAIDEYLASRDARRFAALADEIIQRHAALLAHPA
ncbi:hypothetical protein GCM10009682_36320 [Luedemannella flava]|uniref:CopG family transcriptional regulator n=1 Tax=Luedemannella flava TaxID=349316 RepID=A0ABN2M7A5_9ACTN